MRPYEWSGGLPFETPFGGKTPQARHSSWTGAQIAQPRAGSQAARLLAALEAGPRTRHELSAATGLPIATICARIGTLKRMGFVVEDGLVKGPWGARNVRYRSVIPTSCG